MFLLLVVIVAPAAIVHVIAVVTGSDFDRVAVGDIGSPKHGACKMH